MKHVATDPKLGPIMMDETSSGWGISVLSMNDRPYVALLATYPDRVHVVLLLQSTGACMEFMSEMMKATGVAFGGAPLPTTPVYKDLDAPPAVTTKPMMLNGEVAMVMDIARYAAASRAWLALFDRDKALGAQCPSKEAEEAFVESLRAGLAITRTINDMHRARDVEPMGRA